MKESERRHSIIETLTTVSSMCDNHAERVRSTYFASITGGMKPEDYGRLGTIDKITNFIPFIIIKGGVEVLYLELKGIGNLARLISRLTPLSDPLILLLFQSLVVGLLVSFDSLEV